MYIEENKPVSAQGIDAGRRKNENFPAGDKNNNDTRGFARFHYVIIPDGYLDKYYYFILWKSKFPADLWFRVYTVIVRTWLVMVPKYDMIICVCSNRDSNSQHNGGWLPYNFLRETAAAEAMGRKGTCYYVII